MQGTRSDQENEEGKKNQDPLPSVLLPLLPMGLDEGNRQVEVEESLPWEVKLSVESTSVASLCASVQA